MAVSLRNKTRALQVYNLPHGIVPEHATMSVVGVTEHDPVTGERPVQAYRKPISGSLTFLAAGHDGDFHLDLPNSVLQVAEISHAVKRGELFVMPKDEVAKIKAEKVAAEKKRLDAIEKTAAKAAAESLAADELDVLVEHDDPKTETHAAE